MTKFERIIGLINAPFTPMLPNGDVNYAAIKPYCALLARSGLQGVFLNGSSGEGYMLTEEERRKIAEEWVKAAPPGFKVMVHCGSTCVRMACELAKHAQSIGAWGIGVMGTPFPKISNVQQLAQYCAEIACGAPNLPFYYYHIPALNGVSLPMVPFLKAVDGKIPNFAGIKYTFEALYEENQCKLYGNGKYDILHGQDETILAALACGMCKGGICGTSNYIGTTYVSILEAWAKGDLAKCQELQNFSQEVINVISNFRGNIVAGKRIMKLIGIDCGPNRTPFETITDAEEKQIKAQLDAIDFFSRCNK